MKVYKMWYVMSVVMSTLSLISGNLIWTGLAFVAFGIGYTFENWMVEG
jgi:hypothetical protein